MKYWRGYLAAAIFAAIAWGFTTFAEAHPVLIDLIYPYLTRIYSSSVAGWAAGTSVCIWQVLVLLAVVGFIASGVFMVMFKWNIIQWFGWVVALAVGANMISTVTFGLNAYASPLADDMRLTVTEYGITDLNEAALYYRDQVNALSATVPRTDKHTADLPDFDALAAVANDGFEVLTYDRAIAVFANTTDTPVKKLTMPNLFSNKGDSGVTVTITGESAVNPDVPDAALPYAMCKELSHRISIYSEADSTFAGILACINNPDPAFRYSGYLMAYYYCYQSLQSIPISTAQTCAKNVYKGTFDTVRADLEQVDAFFSQAEYELYTPSKVKVTAAEDENTVLLTYAYYTDATDLLVNWHIQEVILPQYEAENTEPEFDPYDESQVDLSGLVNAK